MSKKACPCFRLSRFDHDLSCFDDQTSDAFVDRSVTLMPMWIEGPFFPEASCGSLIPSHLCMIRPTTVLETRRATFKILSLQSPVSTGAEAQESSPPRPHGGDQDLQRPPGGNLILEIAWNITKPPPPYHLKPTEMKLN